MKKYIISIFVVLLLISCGKQEEEITNSWEKDINMEVDWMKFSVWDDWIKMEMDWNKLSVWDDWVNIDSKEWDKLSVWDDWVNLSTAEKK